jgi:hypothetical protein
LFQPLIALSPFVPRLGIVGIVADHSGEIGNCAV